MVEVVYKWTPARCHTCKFFGYSCKLPETKENGKEGGEIDAEGDNKNTQNTNPKELPHSRLKTKKVDTGKLPQSEESNMGSMSGTGDNKGDNNEAARSSSSGMPLLINNGSINSSPKAKRQKKEEKKGGEYPPIGWFL